jgi:hypothetical protein
LKFAAAVSFSSAAAVRDENSALEEIGCVLLDSQDIYLLLLADAAGGESGIWESDFFGDEARKRVDR